MHFWKFLFIAKLFSLCSSHTFQWAPTQESTRLSFGESLQQNYKTNDFYYIFTGDTQHWHQCTFGNDGCHSAMTCNFQGTQDEVIECQKQHGEYSNRVQQLSMVALKDFMESIIQKSPSGVIINGDLTEYGHDDELTRFNELWSGWNEFKVYPGLGNHDYSNNIDDCTFQHCANRMLKFFKSYVENTLKLKIDLKGRSKNFVQQIFTGSLAYSWDECTTNETCIHFVQLNNYPTYARNIDSPFVEWKIIKSLHFLINDLRSNRDKPTVINFHDFDSAFSETDKNEFKSVLRALNVSQVLGVFFAHFHDQHGLRGKWCINDRNVPLLYTGSVPGNNYLLVQFSPESKSIKDIYKIHADGNELSNVETLKLKKDSCLDNGDS